MFPGLKARERDARPTPEDLGKEGGPLDGGTKSLESASYGNSLPAGYTFLGQFLVHDIIFDPTSIFERSRDPDAQWSFRTPAFELDSVYGSGPDVMPHLYDRKDRWRFLLGPRGVPEMDHDLPRNGQGVALIGDPRNDENLIISQLHFAILKLHNRVLDDVRAKLKLGGEEAFDRARELVCKHYQWIILHDYLPLLCGEDVMEAVRTEGRKFYLPGVEPFIPVEFSAAVFRFGHSQVAPTYRINKRFKASLFPTADEQDLELRGGWPIESEHQVEWRYFFKIDGQKPQPSWPIDTKIASMLLQLPPWAVLDGARSLPQRTLQRGVDLGLPSGQDVARLVAPQDQLSEEELWPPHSSARMDLSLFLGQPAPLWYYILREAENRRVPGGQLGPVGARILAEVFMGLLEKDQQSILHDPGWNPGGPLARFTMADLLKLAGVA